MLKIFKTNQVKALDAYTIEREPIASERLMERAAAAMSEWMYANFDNENRILIFAGPGNNGGDGLVMARLMMQAGYNVRVCFVKISDNISPDCQLNLQRYSENNGKLLILENAGQFPDVAKDEIILDAIFGAGLTRPVEGMPADIIHNINRLSNVKIAVDIPSGLFGENNMNNTGAILKATYTLTLQFPKLAYFMRESADYAGDWLVVDIGLLPEAIEKTESPYRLLEWGDIRKIKKSRRLFDHKGTFGHALLIAGSYGKMGACVLSAKACLRGGAGLLTCHVPQQGYNVLQTSVPEAMLSIDRSDVIFSQHPDLESYNAVGVGPGLGQKNNTQKAVRELLVDCKVPLVLDADALNCLSLDDTALSELPKNSIITPHPKEFARLFGSSQNATEELEKQMDAAKKYGIIIVLKGAFTRIALPDGRLFFNSSGNPALATAGSGDVLTGIILALLAQDYTAEEAALMGVWMHGTAADIYVEDAGMEAMIASDIIDNLGTVFKELGV